ncbi:MAG TPA: cytochrome c oxidase assembly protein, partial [Rugosimonospora sp.]|nr:cytochrome c oxidase assembly protein [Rugosimonospora sp.]
RLEAVLGSRAATFFTVPVVSPLLLAVIPFLLYFTPVYRLSLTHPALLPPVHLVLLLVGVAVLVPLWEADTLATRVPYALALLFALIELLADAVPGIVVRLDTHLLAAGYFAALARPWGPSPLHDQQLGGDLLWCVGEAVDLPFLALLVVQWVRADAREAARVDRELDLAADPDEPLQRPWWETG